MAVSALCCRVFFEREKRFSRLVPRRVSLASGPVEATHPLLGEGVELFVIFSAVQGKVDKMSMHSRGGERGAADYAPYVKAWSVFRLFIADFRSGTGLNHRAAGYPTTGKTLPRDLSCFGPPCVESSAFRGVSV